MRFGLFGGPARRHGIVSDKDAYAAYVETVIEAESDGTSESP